LQLPDVEPRRIYPYSSRAGVIDRKTGQVTEANKEAVRQAVKVLFPPGLINWLDDLVVFHSLAEESVLQIVNVRP
jgi:ATP-dependent Clp protease ATP-binding subunit ClpA